jgi:predicted metal-dependent RNase
MEWIKPMRKTVKKVFVVQGDESAAQTLAGKLRDELALDTIVPKEGDQFELE